MATEDIRDQTANPESPIKMTGNMPPAMRKAMEEVQRKKQPAPKVETCPIPQKPVGKPAAKKPDLFKNIWQSMSRPQGSATLESLMEAVKNKSGTFQPVELPSKGKFYNDEDGPSSGTLNIRSMTAQEENILLTQQYAKKGLNINMILKNCMQEPFNPENFLSIDRNYLLIAI